ncbi:hypothetical protein AVCANL279_07315 [Campylobacter canadensis]|uniref:hypothetical protein n=1 Tax=Campylobacter canadensis TaxID=449520 RepID=UPI001CCD47BB|nr:hypothetical protein [Campylobacter canadensis]MBZ7995176.1 hypothetical protein [Campylobacter canadensis]MBZ7997127.1 hypothetical protein [Campylobacter canadensis]MBZ8003851.1 hypothetical protein [Campylobacter canadensis]
MLDNNYNIINAELIKRELAKKNLVDFMRYKFEKYYNATFNDNWHYDYIAEHLESCLKGDITRLIINEPPSYGKTEQIVKCFMPYAWINHPHLKFIYTTYGGDLTKENAQTTRDFIKSKAYINLGINFKLINDEIYNFSNDKGGRVFSTTVGSAVTGIHCNGLIIDDPLKAIESFSKAAKDKVEDYYKGSLLSRLLDSKSFVIIIMQRLATDDLVGRLEDTGFTKICLKAINEKKEYYYFNNELYYEREANEPLFATKYDLATLERIKTEMGELEFSTQMLQEPYVSEVGFFEKEKLSFINDYEIPSQNDYIIIDSAESTSKTADDRAIVASGISINEDNQTLLIVKDILHGKWELEDFCENAITMMLRYPNAPVFIELAGGGITFHRELLKYINKKNTEFRRDGKAILTNIVQGFKPIIKESKNHQIQALAPLYNTGFLKFKHTCLNKEQAIKELLAFDPAKKNNTDNVIDCIAKMLILDGVYPLDNNNSKNTLSNISFRFKKGGWRI